MRAAGAAAAAGLLAAGAAAAAKAALAPRGGLSALLRGGCLGLALACNALMWTLFAKALRLSSSSAAASVTTAASNFISSAMLGKLLFGETWTPLWWTGLAMTLGGLALLHTAAPQPAPPPGRRR